MVGLSNAYPIWFAICRDCIYKIVVNIEFDPAKDAANLAKHGISLSEAAEFDFTNAVVTVDDRLDYGEVRFRAFAYSSGRGRCLVFAAIDSTTIRAISYRRARQKEMQRYGL